MNLSLQFRNYDSRAPQVARVEWRCAFETDECNEAPDDRDEGFWPSRDPGAAGYVGITTDAQFEEMKTAAQKRWDDWESGVWRYVGVVAVVTFHIPIGCGSFTAYTLKSAGLWGIESDTDRDELNSLFEQEKEALWEHMRSIADLVMSLEPK